MNIVICEKKNVLKLLQETHPKYDAIISINDPYVGSARKWEINKKAKWASKITKYTDKLLILYFWDSVIAEPNGPTIGIIQQIIEFSKKLSKDCNLLIHCKMGVSRSPAAGMIVLTECGMDINDAYEYILTRRPVAIPNTLMLELYNKNFKRK